MREFLSGNWFSVLTACAASLNASVIAETLKEYWSVARASSKVSFRVAPTAFSTERRT